MPLYEYACTDCGRVKEVRHGFDETHDAPCEVCGGPVRRVFSAAPVLFKGSGFYVTDSRRTAARKEEKPKAGVAADSGAPKAEGDPKTEGTPKTDAKGDKAAESAA